MHRPDAGSAVRHAGEEPIHPSGDDHTERTRYGQVVARSLVAFLRYPSGRLLAIEAAVAGLALALGLIFAIVLSADKPPAVSVAGLAETMLLLTPMVVLALARRRWPLTVFLAQTALLIVIRLRNVPELQISSIVFAIGFFSAGRYGKPKWRDVARTVAVISVVALIVRDVIVNWDDIEAFGFTRRTFVLTVIGNIAGNIALFVAAWVGGNFSRRRVEREAELAERTLELEASRAENARRAVMDERVRIARELHDVVAHHVSVMGLQAGAARRIAGSTSEAEAIEAPLRAIESASREAVNELHRLLGFLRRVDEVDPDGTSAEALAPAPGLDRLEALLETVADAGLAVRLDISGRRPVPSSIDVNAYRIVQEALTNCLKYAGVDVADVVLRYGNDALDIEVLDRGRGPANPPDSATDSGRGLVGMAERVALVGGSVHAGARDGGGFEVRARLPYNAAATSAPATMEATGST